MKVLPTNGIPDTSDNRDGGGHGVMVPITSPEQYIRPTAIWLADGNLTSIE